VVLNLLPSAFGLTGDDGEQPIVAGDDGVASVSSQSLPVFGKESPRATEVPACQPAAHPAK
jgi:hypothetical protein